MLVTNSLSSTLTRTDWQFTYLPHFDEAVAGDGTLTVIENTGKRVRRTIVSRYRVEEQPDRGCRCFLVCFESRSGDEGTAAGRAAQQRIGDVYECRLFASGRANCTCPGYAAGGRTCKHAIALAELVETADIAPPQCDPTDRAACAPPDQDMW